MSSPWSQGLELGPGFKSATVSGDRPTGSPPLPVPVHRPVPPTPEADLDAEEFLAAMAAIDRLAAADLKRVEESGGDAHAVIQRHVDGWLRTQLSTSGRSVSNQTLPRLVQAVYNHRYRLSLLTPYVLDERVENIDINGCDEVWIRYRGEEYPVRVAPIATSNAELIAMIQKWALHKAPTPREFSDSNPLLNTTIRIDDEQDHVVGVRLSATMSVTRHPVVSIRCHRLVDVDLDDLLRLGTINRSLHAFLSAAVRARLNIMVIGGVDAGKTTMLRALAAAIDPRERIATLETDYELFLDLLPERHNNVIAYHERSANSEGVGAMSLFALLPDVLRKNPVRIIVGEVRSSEIIPMFEAMNTGHPGSMTSLHADGTKEVFDRIVMLWTRGVGAQTPPSIIHLNTGNTVDLVVHLIKDRESGQRVVSEVMEVMAPGDSVYPARNLVFRPEPSLRGRAVPAVHPQCLPRLIEHGFDPGLLDPHMATWTVGEERVKA